MPSWFRSKSSPSKGKQPIRTNEPSYAPPAWEAAPEPVHDEGLYADATPEDYRAAEAFCRHHPPAPARLLPSAAIEAIRTSECAAWMLEYPASLRFRGHIAQDGLEKGGVIRVQTRADCRDVCLFSNLPILAGLYDTRGHPGVYYEIKVVRMDEGGVIAVGTACRPYPDWRLPGWNRLSVGLHLDDCRKFFEDPDGGRDYPPIRRVAPGDTVGVGFEWKTGGIFFTHNGRRPETEYAFTGQYFPREAHDVYAAIGVSGPGVCEFEVNFGTAPFEWKRGEDWKVRGHVGMAPGGAGGADDQLPSYSEARNDRPVTYQ